ncbi:MAG: hypothetical protein NTV80_15045 [Verrucomicrobia bacterium]|nr:hypothetical protein [Verrucomicrobiota bacterium]
MKLKSMTSVITKSALVLAACASVSAFAGTSAPAKGVTPPIEEGGALFDTLGATLEVGYDSRYYFRGLWFADNTTWAGLSLSVPLTEKLSLGFGTLYTSTVDTLVNTVNGEENLDYSELDLSASLTYDAGFAKLGLVYTHYEFFDTFSGTTNPTGPFNSTNETGVTGVEEVGATIATSVGPVNLYGGFYYDFTIGASYAEVGADAPIAINSWLSLVPAVKAGYGFTNYYTIFPGGRQSGLTHVVPSLSAPIKLTKTATLTPYVAYNISLDTRHLNNTQDSEFFGGVKLGVTF